MQSSSVFFFWLWFNMLRLMLRRSLAANSIHAFSQIACKATRLTHLYNLGTFGLKTSHFVWHCCSTCKSRFFQFCLLNLLLPRLKEVPMLKILLDLFLSCNSLVYFSILHKLPVPVYLDFIFSSWLQLRSISVRETHGCHLGFSKVIVGHELRCCCKCIAPQHWHGSEH